MSTDPGDLLRPDEREVPLGVRRTVAFFQRRGVWFSLSRNHDARSCRDAAHKRWRLGHEGIPLWDELKSFFGQLPGEPARYVVVHCRGDRQLNFERLASALTISAPPTRLPPGELDSLGMAYGLVNPFEPWALDGQLIASPVLQVFDSDLLTPIALPGTVMTNAGNLTWAVEFRAEELAEAIDHKVVANIAEPDPDEPPRPPIAGHRPAIGIITGNGPESGIALWERVNSRVRELLGSSNYGDISMPRVVVHSLPEMGLSMELSARHELVWAAMSKTAQAMCEEGVGFLSVACNTTQYFGEGLREICAPFGAEFVSLPEAVAAWLRARSVDKVALVGIRYVSELGPWSAYREPFADFTVERPSSAGMQRIEKVAYEVKKEGPNQSSLNKLRDILRIEFSSEYVILALTELSVLIDLQRTAGRSGKVLVDPLSVYADALTARFLGLAFPLSP